MLYYCITVINFLFLSFNLNLTTQIKIIYPTYSYYRLKTLITITQEAKSRPKVNKREVKTEHIYKAKEKFQLMKNELHGLIHSLFPNADNMIIDTLGVRYFTFYLPGF